MQKAGKARRLRKPQHQLRPGLELKMVPEPVSEVQGPGSGKLRGKVALITGGDSGIGRAVAALFAKEGASVCIAYLSEDKDAEETKRMVEKYSQCLIIRGDLSKESHCRKVVAKTVKEFKKIDVLVNNAGVHYESKRLEDINSEQLLDTFSTNIFSFFSSRKISFHIRSNSFCCSSTFSCKYRSKSTSII